jgi:hypothetical protein
VLAHPAIVNRIVRTAVAAIRFGTGDCTIPPKIGYRSLCVIIFFDRLRNNP